MASLEAKILGERAENYCSSDEGDHEEDRDPCGPVQPSSSFSAGAPPPGSEVGASKWAGTSQNTGPKGVLRDWELFKEHQALLRVAQEQELIRMVKDSSLSCRTEGQETQVRAY